jgi:glycosyltransferase involved in cell wall biosynthesis
VRKPRVLYFLGSFPQVSQTYIKTEIEGLSDRIDIRVVAEHEANIPYATEVRYDIAPERDMIEAIVDDFRPDLIHVHYLHTLVAAGSIAKKRGIPFTVRTHSFDVLVRREASPSVKQRLRRSLRPATKLVKRLAPPTVKSIHYVNDPLCLGVLVFPFVVPRLERQGADPAKLIPCHPVVDYDLFYDRSPNGDAIMNVGAATRKKSMHHFIELAGRIPQLDFNLYAMGYRVDRLKELNVAAGSPVTIMPVVEPNEMPAEYKKHRWLVYTASFDIATVGWPMAVAEAQASGVGVCMPRIREDVKEYVGEGGYLYDSIEEVDDIITGPVPDEMREAGFAQAKLSDINTHLHLLTDLWEAVSISAR